ncbi:EamA family transporter [Actinotalea sp. Marseille-Q4924]|uniref:EamA family transporter n=1 Tax=Actinotalea sp. Marseille-Q4924 TaxID=2866571 RepID=UPI001CE40894|nr:EamA family transporter [Actinotalea sp. Marseille-Q4924]
MTVPRPGVTEQGAPAPGDDATSGRRGFLAVVAGAVLWGTGGLAGSALAAQGTPMATVAASRLLVGGGVLVLALLALGRLRDVRWHRVLVRRVLVTAVLAALYQGSYFVAVGRSSVSLATVVALGAAPVLVAAATAVLARRAPSARTVLAVALAVVGLVLLVGLSGAGAEPAAGAALALGAAAAFAALTVVNRTPVTGLDPVLLTALGFTGGGLLLVPVALLAGGPLVPTGPTGWWLVLYLGVVPTALAYAAYFTGLRTVPATTASLVALLEPLTAALLAAALLGERLGLGGAVGGLLLAAATVVVAPRRRGRVVV